MTLVVKATLLALTFFVIKSNSLHVATQPRELSALSSIGKPSVKEPPLYSSPVIQDCVLAAAASIMHHDYDYELEAL